jgi:hypothetical protein
MACPSTEPVAEIASNFRKPSHPPGSLRVRRLPGLLLSVVLAGGLCAGCVSTQPEEFSRQVRQWVPLGTPTARAEEIMASHGFECHQLTREHPFNQYGLDCLDCDREQTSQHNWNVILFLEEGRVSKYGPVRVDDKSISESANQ